jgi:hypothetical protein
MCEVDSFAKLARPSAISELPGCVGVFVRAMGVDDNPLPQKFQAYIVTDDKTHSFVGFY